MSLIDLVFPKNCLGCGEIGSYICKVCEAKNTKTDAVCPYCERLSIDGFTHKKCIKKFGLNGLTSVYKYDGVIKKAIQTFKYRYATQVGSELTRLFINRLSDKFLPNPDYLVPVPIYWYRENIRGFNQSEQIGRSLAKSRCWDFLPNLIIRSKSVKPQAGLTVEERKSNLRGIFEFNSNLLAKIPTSVLIFDDVFTTGSTLHEICKVLKRSGVKNVWGLTVAR